MEDNEIIKSLECCGIKRCCRGCYFDTHESGDLCVKEIIKNALDLIARQQAEIERLQKDNSEWVHLPCKVGDTVYCFEPCFDKDCHQRLKIVGKKIVDMKTTATVLGLYFDVDKIGKTVFLTREEAEKALKERT